MSDSSYYQVMAQVKILLLEDFGGLCAWFIVRESRSFDFGAVAVRAHPSSASPLVVVLESGPL